MGKFNFGEFLNNNIFKTDEMKQITGFFGKIGNTGLGFVTGMMQNMQNIGSGIGNMLNSSFLLPVLLVGGAIFVSVRLKII